MYAKTTGAIYPYQDNFPLGIFVLNKDSTFNIIVCMDLNTNVIRNQALYLNISGKK